MKRLLGIAALFISIPAFAQENAEVCIKFEKEIGWSKGYAVEGLVISGSDLNRAVNSFTKYKSFSTYVVVFWGEDQASIFELPPLSLGNVPMFETTIEDQEGRKWKMKEGHLFCN